MMSADEILDYNRRRRDAAIALGVSHDRQERYYSALSPENDDPNEDEKAFANATSDLNLSTVDLAFIKEVLDSGDGRGGPF